MQHGRRRDHGVFGQCIGFSVHETRPLAESGCVHRQHSVGNQDPVQPGFQFVGLRLVLFSGDFDPRLYLSYRNGGYEELLCWDIGYPSQYGAVWARPTQFRDDVGIEEIQVLSPPPGESGGDVVFAAA